LKQKRLLRLVPGYRVAGKTGTAQIPVDGFYDTTRTNTSFIGWGPVDDPQFMIYVWLERPIRIIWGAETAAPVFAEMAEKTVILLDIPPDYIRQQLVAKNNMLTLADALEALTSVRISTATPVITEAAIDSRQVIPGSLFVAIPGENVDGHDFIERCIQEGGIFCFNSKRCPASFPTLDLRAGLQADTHPSV
jgi:hypothetical protein